MSADTDMVDLKACPLPWCEAPERAGDFSAKVMLHHFGNYRVVCTSCRTEGPLAPTKAEAIAAWNTRAALDASGIGELKAQNAALREARDALIAELSRERQVRMELQTRLLDGDRP